MPGANCHSPVAQPALHRLRRIFPRTGADTTTLSPSRIGVPGVAHRPPAASEGVGSLLGQPPAPWVPPGLFHPGDPGAHPTAGRGFGGDNPTLASVTAGLCQHRSVAIVLHIGFPCQPWVCLAEVGDEQEEEAAAKRGAGNEEALGQPHRGVLGGQGGG